MIWQYRPWLSRHLPATARRRRVPTAAPMLGLPAAAWILFIGSCYKTNFNNIIYKCDQYLCPIGLVCNSDKYCVNSPVEGCSNGGLVVDANTFQCPGTRNNCQPGFAACASPSPELACEHDSPPPNLGTATGNVCVTCCRQ